MIGMMNSGAESSVEFYAAARQSSLYDARKRSNPLRTYTPEGRVLVNGAPLSPTLDANDLWKNMIIKTAAQKMIRENCEKKESGPMATIKRLSEKFKLKKSKSSAAMMNLDLDLDIPEVAEVESSSKNLETPKTTVISKAPTQFVTNITIDESDFVQPVDRPQMLFEDTSVLARLMEESALMDKMEKESKDSGKGSIDDEMVVVHKM
ncbi:Protein CBG00664 [Caenorhabditis briggsae]|uniref:Protein CBG00664 n=2 Tax=Caenorhabditis briggsae TaxID=6238 RepID=A8WNC2_CAEBR|nr:Protein CBG00664 [Caenorhabditis briggsae]ULU04452.1 hypothetical protein L3Y34_017311 [Caenorhabditis briggsae]CAP21976.2 Protein CBG00664 [Caenorhabditis briggsae]